MQKQLNSISINKFPNDDQYSTWESLKNSSINELSNTLTLLFSIGLSSLLSVFFILALLILDNILAFYIYLKQNQTHKWKSEHMLTGIAVKMAIYGFAIVFSITIDKTLHLHNVFSIIAITLIAQPELKSIDEKMEQIFNRSVFKFITNFLSTILNKNYNINLHQNENTTTNEIYHKQQNNHKPNNKKYNKTNKPNNKNNKL